MRGGIQNQQRKKESKILKKNCSNQKLPNSIDWTCFWSKYEVEIYKSKISSVAKFSYLKQLEIPKSRASIDSVPLTPDGNKRTKNIDHKKLVKLMSFQTHIFKV